MKLRFEHGLFEKIVKDLSRPHPFAFERVGYMLSEFQANEIVVNDWISFEDKHYVETEDVGARIGPEAMTMVIQKAFKSKKHFFHVHMHDFQAYPEFSFVDLRSLKDVTPSLFDFSDQGVHGGFLIGREKSKLVWWEEKECKTMKEIMVDFCITNMEDL